MINQKYVRSLYNFIILWEADDKQTMAWKLNSASSLKIEV